MKIIKTLLFLTAFSVLACETNTSGEEAVVSEAEEVREIPSAADIYDLDTVSSKVNWIGTKPTGQHHGTIAVKSGAIAIVDGSIVGGEIIIDLNKIDAIDLRDDPENYNRLVNHLKSNDFFDVARHPEASFVILEVIKYQQETIDMSDNEEVAGNVPKSAYEHRVEKPTHTIKGNLTLRGTTLAISFPATVSLSDTEVFAEAKFNIDRTRWGLMYKNEGDIRDKAKDSFIYNTVNTGFTFRAILPTSL